MNVPLLNRPFWLLVRFYQMTLSYVIGRYCRHYPTCSNYALWQLETQPLLPALWATLLRVLRCNPLFEGGIDYPKVPAPKMPAQRGKIAPVKWWYAPDGKGRYYLIKRFKEKH